MPSPTSLLTHRWVEPMWLTRSVIVHPGQVGIGASGSASPTHSTNSSVWLTVDSSSLLSMVIPCSVSDCASGVVPFSDHHRRSNSSVPAGAGRADSNGRRVSRPNELLLTRQSWVRDSGHLVQVGRQLEADCSCAGANPGRRWGHDFNTTTSGLHHRGEPT